MSDSIHSQTEPEPPTDISFPPRRLIEGFPIEPPGDAVTENASLPDLVYAPDVLHSYKPLNTSKGINLRLVTVKAASAISVGEESVTTAGDPSHSYAEESHVSTISEASSSIPSNRTVKLSALFPSDQPRFGSFKKQSRVTDFLTGILQLDAPFIARLEQLGYVSMAVIVNRFGLDTRSITETFSIMGPKYILDPEVQIQTH